MVTATTATNTFTSTPALTDAINNMLALWTGLFGLPTALFWLLVVGLPLVLLFVSLRTERRRG